MWRATRNAESATQSVARMRSHAERGNEGQSAIPAPGARSLRTRAASLRSGGGSVARQTVLAEQHPCSAGPPRVRPPGSESQHEETKVLTRKAHNLRRRDYMDTCPMDQGGLAGMTGDATSYGINTYNTRARNPFRRRARPLWCRRPACLFGGRCLCAAFAPAGCRKRLVSGGCPREATQHFSVPGPPRNTARETIPFCTQPRTPDPLPVAFAPN
jgi:hypothetical protein